MTWLSNTTMLRASPMSRSGRGVLGVGTTSINSRQQLLRVQQFSTKRKGDNVVGRSASHAPFALSKQSIHLLRRDIESSHKQFQEDWKRRILTSTEDHVVQGRKAWRKQFASVLRKHSVKNIGLLATAKHDLMGTALHARTEEDGLKEYVDEVIVAEQLYAAEVLAKKGLYAFPSIYSHMLDEIFNKKLFQSSSPAIDSKIDSSHDNASSYLEVSGAVTPQLARALRSRWDSFAKAGIETSVKVRQEPSPPTVLGYASRFQMVLTGNSGLPKELSLLHVPGGAVDLRYLPTEQQLDLFSLATACVHVLIHTHETYRFAQRQAKSRSKPKSVKWDGPRILTLLGRFDVPNQPSQASLQNCRSEVELAVMEDMKLEIFNTHNPNKYNRRYPDGCPMNDNLGITWQLADIDFLVARTNGWIEIGETIQVNNRFCFQPPDGFLEFDKNDANEGPDFVLGAGAHDFTLLALLSVLLALLLDLDELPGWVKTMMVDHGFTLEDIEKLEMQLPARRNLQKNGE